MTPRSPALPINEFSHWETGFAKSFLNPVGYLALGAFLNISGLVDFFLMLKYFEWLAFLMSVATASLRIFLTSPFATNARQGLDAYLSPKLH